jgi:hypothetical protein
MYIVFDSRLNKTFITLLIIINKKRGITNMMIYYRYSFKYKYYSLNILAITLQKTRFKLAF